MTCLILCWTFAGTPIDPANLRRLVRVWGRQARLDKQLTPYGLRRSACTILCDGGVRAELVADVLGHVDTRMVMLHYRHQTAPSVTAAVATGTRSLSAERSPSQTRADDASATVAILDPMARQRLEPIVVERIDPGWAVVTESSWTDIHRQLETVARLERCQTWGEARAIGPLPEDLWELIKELNGSDGEWPADTDAFSLDLGDSEWYELNSWLARATTDFASELPDDLSVEVADTWEEKSYVEDEKIDAFIDRLLDLGYDVRRL